MVKTTCKKYSTYRFRKRIRVPVVRQLSSFECGAAALAMIAGYYGREVSISECRLHFDIGRDGLSVPAIASAATKLGLRARAYRVEPSDLASTDLPAIAHWNFKHFMVVEKWSPTYVRVVDPATGRRRIPSREFDECFTGVIITFEPDDTFRMSQEPRQHVLRDYLGSILRLPSAGKLFGQVFLCSLLMQVLTLGLPLFTKVLFDDILPTQFIGLITLLGMGMFLIVVTDTFVNVLRGLLLISLRSSVDTNLMFQFVQRLFALPFKFFQQRTSGDLLLRMQSVSIIRDTVTNRGISMVLDGGLSITYTVFLLIRYPLLGGAVLIIAILHFAILYGVAHRVHGLTESELVARAEEQSYAFEVLSGIATIKACGVEHRALDRWSRLFVNELNLAIQQSRLLLFIEASISLLRKLTPLAIIWIGGLSVLRGELSVGTLLAVNVLATYALTPIGSLVENGQQLQMLGAHLERIGDVVRETPEEPAGPAKQKLALKGQIEVSDVHFSYNSCSETVLSGVSFTVNPGETLAIVGSTGSGKSTLALILLGLYRPTQGSIKYDGVLMSELDLGYLRSQFGVVLQEAFSFSGSIRQNISLTSPDMSMKDLVAAADRAAIHESISRMPMGYETMLIRGTLSLSGGERQRLSIARALANGPKILILDEATSNLDTKTENLIQDNLKQIGCTKILIAHRLSTIKNADRILVLEKGAVIEQGSHEELLTLGGNYASLVRAQNEL